MGLGALVLTLGIAVGWGLGAASLLDDIALSGRGGAVGPLWQLLPPVACFVVAGALSAVGGGGGDGTAPRVIALVLAANALGFSAVNAFAPLTALLSLSPTYDAGFGTPQLWLEWAESVLPTARTIVSVPFLGCVGACAAVVVATARRHPRWDAVTVLSVLAAVACTGQTLLTLAGAVSGMTDAYRLSAAHGLPLPDADRSLAVAEYGGYAVVLAVAALTALVAGSRLVASARRTRVDGRARAGVLLEPWD